MQNSRPTTSTVLSIVRSLSLFIALLLLTTPLYAAPSDLDPTWDEDGIVEVDFDNNGPQNDTPVTTLIQRDGTYLVIGYYHDESLRFGAASYLANGQPNPQFGINGIAVLPQLSELESMGIYPHVASVQSDGKIIIGSHGPFLFRLDSHGFLDTTFGDGGFAFFDPMHLEFGRHGGFITKIIVNADDSIIVGGFAEELGSSSFNGAFVARFDRDGHLDTNFDSNGVLFPDDLTYLPNLKLQPDGKLLIAGTAKGGFGPDCPYGGAGLLRLNPDGTRDNSFGENGLVSFFPLFLERGSYEDYAWISGIEMMSDGQLILNGYITGTCDFFLAYPESFIARLTNDGSLDSSIGENGIIITPSASNNITEYLRSALQANGKLVVAHLNHINPHTLHGITRFNADGSFDATWNGTGILNIEGFNANDYSEIVIDPNGRIISTHSTFVRRFEGDPAFGYTALNPIHRQKHIAPNANLSLTFPGTVTINTGKIEIRRVDDFSLFEAIPVTDGARVTGGGTTSIIINPSVDFEPNTKYYVLIDPNTFTNASGHPFFGVRELTEWHFTTGNGTPVANNPPVLAAIGSPSVIAEQLLSFKASASDLDDWQQLTFSLSGNVPTGASIFSQSGVFIWTPTEAQIGEHTFTVVVTDNGDPNLSDSETITVSITENTAPTLTAIGDKSIEAEQTLSFTATATDPDTSIGQILTFSLAGDVPPGATINPATGSFLWTPTEAQIGQHSFDVTVTDDGDPNLSDSETITVTVTDIPFVNTAPTLTAIGDKSIEAEQTLSFTATATDPDTSIGQILTFSLAGDVPSGATINPATGSFLWTPTQAQIGQHTFDVVVTDNGDPNLSDSETITVTVTDIPFVNTAPTLTAIGDKSIEAEQTLSFTATATDPDTSIGQILTFSLAGDVPSGATINASTGAFSWTPTKAQVGQHTFDVVVTDNGDPNLSDSETITVMVDEIPFTNTAPTLGAIGNKSVEAEQTLSFTATATDPDTTVGQLLTFSLAGDVPSGATINASTGAFSWTPTEAQVGQHSFDVVVTDNGDPTLSDSETLTLTVTLPVVVPPLNLIKNAGFEGKGGKAIRAAKWTVNKLASADRRICNVERDGKPDLIYAHNGKCAFRFQSSTVKARNIQQEILLTNAFAEQTLDLSAFVKTSNLTSGAKVQVMLTYTDDTKKIIKLNIARGTKPYRKIQTAFVLPKDATSARVRIITGKNKGTLLIDDLSLTISETAALPMSIQVPAAPDLRGQ